MAQIGSTTTKDIFSDWKTYTPFGIFNIANKVLGKSPQEKKSEEIALGQAKRAGQLKKTLDTTDRPQKTAMVERLLEMYGTGGLTEQQKTLAEENIARSSASALRDVSSLGGGLRNIGQIQGQAADASQQLAATDAELEQQRKLSIGSMLAQAEAEAEEYNKLLPYEQMLVEYQSMIGSSLQNQMLSSQLQTERGAQNLQMGMDLLGAGIGLASGNILGALGGVSGATQNATGGTQQFDTTLPKNYNPYMGGNIG